LQDNKPNLSAADALHFFGDGTNPGVRAAARRQILWFDSSFWDDVFDDL
jgi:hypothetical protein